jgi:hypothetical protein
MSLAARPRLKLPAFGRQLLNERRLGRHPGVVHVVYGEDWFLGDRCELDCADVVNPGEAHPRLAVKPSQFQLWELDWRVVTGLHVCVFDRREDVLVGAREFFGLIGEVGRFSAQVDIYRRALEARPQFCFAAHVIAAECRKAEGAWPGWWPAETENMNADRRARWRQRHAAADPARAAA